MVIRIIFLGLMTAALGCAPDLRTENGEPVSFELHEGEVVVNATSEDEWVSFDLDSGELGVEGWDLEFQRFKIRLNSKNGVKAAILDEPFNAENIVWSEDDESNPDEAFYVFEDLDEGWFDYNIRIHVLTPKDRIYLVKTSDQKTFSIRINAYYDDAGTAGKIHFTYQELSESQN